jgi:hypothetical protein
MADGANTRRVAVIAVHGVADQQPSESAEALGAMLLAIDGPEAAGLAAYEPFQSRVIHVPLKPAPAPNAPDPVGGSVNAPGDAGLYLMRLLLGRYKGLGKRSYLTNRLEGRRRKHASETVTECEVDIYEMYWADLSRLGNDPLRVFGSIYHLLLHLSELGMLALEAAGEEFRSIRRWRMVVAVQQFAVTLLTLLIPILNLLVLLTLAVVVLTRFVGGSVTKLKVSLDSNALAADPALKAAAVTAYSNTTALRFAAIVGMTVIIVGLTYWAASKWLRPRFWGWWFVPIVAVMVGAVLGRAALQLGRADLLLALECWVVGFFLFDFLLQRYDGVISDARRTGWALYLIALSVFLVALVEAFRGDRFLPREVEYASLWTLQLLIVALSAIWIALIIAGVLAVMIGQPIVRTLPDPACARARAALRTSRLTLGISASGMLGIIAIVFSGLLAWGITRASAFECMETKVVPPLFAHEWILSHPGTLQGWLGAFPDVPACPGVPYPVHGYLRGMLMMATTTGFPLALFLVGLCILLLAWMALPSVRFEGNSPSESTNRESQRAGEWLSSGLDATKIIAHLWWISFFVILILFGAGDFAYRHGWLIQVPILERVFKVSASISFPLLNQTGTLIAASSALIVFVVVKLGGSALDVAIDVDNYLREEPRKSPPRARIAERYVSLLRYIGNRRNAETGRRAYDSVIIVAHSLGALISCDLLRYLESESSAGRGDPALAPLGFHRADQKGTIPVHLFTMGNPLRQLLNRFFPHHYVWVRSHPDNSMSGTAEKAKSMDTAGNFTPSPDELGVATWVNAYRSGDYVGRSIWSNDWYSRNDAGDDRGGHPEPITTKKYGASEEICIGLGAHTHYWDETAPDIRDRLDQIIRDACRAASKSAT